MTCPSKRLGPGMTSEQRDLCRAVNDALADPDQRDPYCCVCDAMRLEREQGERFGRMIRWGVPLALIPWAVLIWLICAT